MRRVKYLTRAWRIEILGEENQIPERFGIVYCIHTDAHEHSICQEENLGVEHLNIGIDILNISDIINIDSEGHTYKTRKDLIMVYAKDMHERVEQVRQEQAEKVRKETEERVAQAVEKTKQYCHSVLSRMIEEVTEKGGNSLSIDITKENKDGISNLIEYDNGYGITNKIIMLEKMKNILSDHSYTVAVGERKFRTYCGKYRYQDIWHDGYRVTITW